MTKCFALKLNFDYILIFKLIEEFATEVMLDQTVFLLIYFSLYFVIIIQQLNKNLKISLNEKTVLHTPLYYHL